MRVVPTLPQELLVEPAVGVAAAGAVATGAGLTSAVSEVAAPLRLAACAFNCTTTASTCASSALTVPLWRFAISVAAEFIAATAPATADAIAVSAA